MNRELPEAVLAAAGATARQPGCYQMLNRRGDVITVDEALVLLLRAGYFHSNAQHTAKDPGAGRRIRDIAWWVTKTELKALILNRLIKRSTALQHPPEGRRSTTPSRSTGRTISPRSKSCAICFTTGRCTGPYTQRHACAGASALTPPSSLISTANALSQNGTRVPVSITTSKCAAAPASAHRRGRIWDTLRQLMDFLNGDSEGVLARWKAQMARHEGLWLRVGRALPRPHPVMRQIADQQKMVAAKVSADYVALAQDALPAYRRTGLHGSSWPLDRRRTHHRRRRSSAGDVNQHGLLVGTFIQRRDNAAFIPQADSGTGHAGRRYPRGMAGGGTARRQRQNYAYPSRWLKHNLMGLTERTQPNTCASSKQSGPPTPTARPKPSPICNKRCSWNTAPRIRCFRRQHAAGNEHRRAFDGHLCPRRTAEERLQAFQDRGKKAAKASPTTSPACRDVARNPPHHPEQRFRRQEKPLRRELAHGTYDLVIVDGSKGQIGPSPSVLGEFGLLDASPS